MTPLLFLFFSEAMLKRVYFSTIVKNLVHLPNKKVFFWWWFHMFQFSMHVLVFHPKKLGKIVSMSPQNHEKYITVLAT